MSEVGDSHPAIGLVNKEIMERLGRDHDNGVGFFVESFDTGVFDNETSQRDIREWYPHNYRNQKLDAIVTVGSRPLAFLTRAAEPPFPNVPVVFCGAPLGTLPAPKLAPRFTGTWPQFDTAKTIDLAQHLLPETRRIAARIVSEILQGKKPEVISVSTAPNFDMFEWKELRRWQIKEPMLPAGTAVYFREVTRWERTWWIWAISLAIILGLAALVAYLKRGREQLQLARERQRQLSGMLINAEEKERSRLASELHDDFSQRVALLALGMENAAELIPHSPELANRQLLELLNCASEIGADLHTLSHRLHSSTLQSLGLVPGVSALCKEFATQQGIQVEFSPQNVPQTVAPDEALCLFRIVQEGLRNVKRHSGAAKARVVLRKAGDKLYVAVCDEGVGFDLKQSRQKEGLGLRSMEERASLLCGCFEIHSEPGRGTTVEAWVPIHLATGVEHAKCESM